MIEKVDQAIKIKGSGDSYETYSMEEFDVVNPFNYKEKRIRGEIK